MRARTVLPATVAVAAMLLVGCTGPNDEPSDPTNSPASDPSPSPTPSPTPTDGIQVHSDPATGIVFEDVPNLTGDEAEVYNWIAIYQNAFWETQRTNQVSPTFATMSSTTIQDVMARIASNNASAGIRVGGTFTTKISDIVVTGDTATGVTCSDLRQATVTTDEGEFTAEEAGQGVPQRNRLELVRRDGGVWFVNNLVGEGSC